MQKVIKLKRKFERKYKHKFKLYKISIEETSASSYIDYYYQCVSCKCYMFHYKQLFEKKKIVFYFCINRKIDSFSNGFLSCQQVIIKSIIE